MSGAAAVRSDTRQAATAAASGSPGRRFAIAAVASAPSRRAPRATSSSGSSDDAPGVARHWPVRTVRSGARRGTSSTSRDLPIPGCPSTVTRCGRPVWSVRSSVHRSRSSSASRPIIGRSSRRRWPCAEGSTPSSRHAGSGSRLPFAATGATRSPRAACATSAQVAAPTSTSPGAAACSSRAATFTASPTTSDSPGVASRASTSPVFTPMRAWMSPIARTASRISSAARTARRASSSWTTGIPNTATSASPITFSTVPP